MFYPYLYFPEEEYKAQIGEVAYSESPSLKVKKGKL